MEQRKLIRLGNSSFAISLPISWIKKANLKKGDNISLIKNSNGELIISPKFEEDNEDYDEITINVEGKNENRIRKEFFTAYIKGYKVFHFKGEINREITKIVKNTVKNFISCEITRNGGDQLTVKDFFKFKGMNIQNFIKRADNNIREMFDIILNNLKDNCFDKNNLKAIKEADFDINKLYFLNSRIFSLGIDNPAFTHNLKTDTFNLFNNWWISFNFEHMGDQLKDFAELLVSDNKFCKDENKLKAVTYLKKIKEIYKKTMEAFYKKDEKKAYEISKEARKFWQKCKKLKKSDSIFSSSIGEKLKNMENISYQIIKMVLNLEDKE